MFAVASHLLPAIFLLGYALALFWSSAATPVTARHHMTPLFDQDKYFAHFLLAEKARSVRLF